MAKTEWLTHADLVEQVVRKADLMCRDECKDYWTEADETEHIQQLKQLRWGLLSLSESAFYLLRNVVTPGYVFDCKCGAVHEIDGHTGEMKTIEPEDLKGTDALKRESRLALPVMQK